jgi:hypothetical protein
MVDYIGYWILDQCTGTVFYIHYLLFATQECLPFRTSFQIYFTFSKLRGGRSTNAITVI